MNREDIIKLALAAGIFHEYDSEGHWDGLTNEALIGKDWLSSKEHKLDRIVEILSPFAVLVAAAEREACAKVCDVLAVHPEYASDITKVAAQEIRARGNK
jgi:hypothetical protein